MTTTRPATLVLTQDVRAPVERVWAAWTEPAALAAWWWPQLPDTTYDLDVRVGGTYAIRSALAGIGVHGTYVALDAPDRLELTWVWEDGEEHGPEEQVVVTLEATDDGTRVTVTHRLAEEAGAEDFRQGWADCLARLGQVR